MSEDQGSPITLSREDLYELVWSKPMLELAKDFGISDVALAKRCRRLGILVPGRGYWARVDAGQQPYRPTLPQREPEWFDQDALTVAPSVNAPPISNSSHLPTEDQTWLKERLAFEERPDSKIEVPPNTRKWDPVIQGYSEDLELAAEEMRESCKANERYEKWPASRKRVDFANSGYKWRQVRDRGQRLWDTHKPVAFRVSLDTYKRALDLTNALAFAAASREFTVRADDEIGRLAFVGHDAEIHLYVTEILQDKTRPRIRYDGKTEQEKYKVPTGRLRIALQIGHRTGPSFEDRDSLNLESQLNRVFAAMYRLVIKAWQRDREHREFRRRMEEEENRRAETERLRAERATAVAEERARRRHLLAEASNWARSKRIREYVAHIRAATCEREALDSLDSWAKWALLVASELDPTETRLTENSKANGK